MSDNLLYEPLDEEDYDASYEEDLPQEAEEEESSERRSKRSEKKSNRKSKTDRLLALLEEERREKNRFIQESNEAQRRYYEAVQQNERLASESVKAREEFLNITEEAYKNDLAYSREINDVSRQGELEERLFEIRAEKRDLEREREARALRNIQSGAQQTYHPIQYDDRPIPTRQELVNNSYFEDFLSEHPYADVRNKDVYNPSLQAKASELSSELAAKYALEGKKHKVYSKEYWDEMSELMREEVDSLSSKSSRSSKSDTYIPDDEVLEDPVRYGKMSSSKRTVAPVRSSSGLRSKSTTTRSTLTPDQEKFIENASRVIRGVDPEAFDRELRESYEQENRGARHAR